ncbi:MAG: hypothetical protein GXO12_02745 [Epsilonproteobacteria bacterium]|nr:hypothetical protein [Campylobacterota bacterium]
MIGKVIGSFFLGLMLYLLLDFLFFIGIKINYIDVYRIKEFYNLLFVDHQNYILLIVLSALFGFLITNKSTSKIFAYFYIVLIAVTLSTLYRPIGKSIAEKMFRKNDLSFRLGKVKFHGDLLYKGRVYSYIYRGDINKVIKLRNDEFSQSE